ncbi:hypothetical protein [Ramlibacter sp. AN1133]|uniref:hypothetical protein n=1 Tax=Ramlibacter sp. AN1133 TaxID=3133429 RepID=UPI0030C4F753
MPRVASVETQLKATRAELNRATRSLERVQKEADAYRARATSAEREAAEWKQRFDILLRRDAAASQPVQEGRRG